MYLKFAYFSNIIRLLFPFKYPIICDTLYFGGMDKVKFKRQVVPGDVLRLNVDIIKSKGNIGVGNAIAYVDEQVATKAVFTFVIG